MNAPSFFSFMECLSIAMIVMPCVLAEQAAPRYDWEDPSIIGRNKEPAHATMIPYPNAEQALEGNREESSFFQLLNGDWTFHWSPRPAVGPRISTAPASTTALGAVFQCHRTGRWKAMIIPYT